MDLRYATALRTATKAWANNQTTDTLTMQELQKRPVAEQSPVKTVLAPTATQMAILQPELARYGNLGTKLNIFA